MTKNVRSGLITLIAFLLIIAAIVGMIALVNKVDESLTPGSALPSHSSSSSGTDVVTDTAGNMVSSEYYIDEVHQTGYRTYNGVTYFFKIVKDDADGNKVFTIDENDIQAYGTYELTLKYGFDTISWIDFDWWAVQDNLAIAQKQTNSQGYLYVLYTTVTGCTSPRYVLEDLNQNVFTNPEIFSYDMANAYG